MTYDPTEDKRQVKRFLCDEYFSQCRLEAPDLDLSVTAIDFSKEGMGLFSNEHIPESGCFRLSLSYDNPNQQHSFDNLPCTLVYCNLTEVGSHCGVRFELEQISPAIRTALEDIELCLSTLDDPDDRYHLFGDD